MDYADTGFIVSLYLEEQTSERARAALSSTKEPLVLTSLHSLEIHNAFNMALNRGRLTKEQHALYLRAWEDDIKGGLFVESTLPVSEWHRAAIALSDRHTAKLATRSLDLLHVAAAKLLDAKTFYSFDERQRKAAEAEGLKVKPQARKTG